MSLFPFLKSPLSPGYRAVRAVSWVLPSCCLDYQRSVYLSVLAASAVSTTSRHCLTQRSTANYCCCKLSELSHTISTNVGRRQPLPPPAAWIHITISIRKGQNTRKTGGGRDSTINLLLPACLLGLVWHAFRGG